MSLKSSFTRIDESNAEQHPLLFLAKNESCWAFAKAQRGYFYLVLKGATWKVIHVNRRNAIEKFTVVWRKYLPQYKIPLTRVQVENIENKLIEGKIKTYRYKSRYPKDKQVKAVYAWEQKFDTLWPSAVESLLPADGKELVNVIVEDLGLKPVRIIHKNARKNGRYDALAYGGYKIELFSTSKAVLLHELAHSIHTQFSKELLGGPPYRYQSHGKEFVSFYLYLLLRYAQMDEKFITESLTWDEIVWDETLLNTLKEKYPFTAYVLIDNDDEPGEQEWLEST